MRTLIVGAGAIGVYIGMSLARRGHPVVYLTRPATGAALRQHGLRFRDAAGETFEPHPVVAASYPEAVKSGPFDVVVLAVKSYDTRAALGHFPEDADSLPPFLCLQNGVDNETILAERLGAGKVIAGTVTTAVVRPSPHVVIVEKARGVGIAAGHPLSEKLVGALVDAGLTTRLYPHAGAMKWSKLLTNLPANATSAILDRTPAEVYAHPGLYNLEIDQLREGLSVIAALGLPLVDLPGAPVRVMALLARRVPRRLSRPALRRAIAGGRGGKMPSFHIDLHGGKHRTEVASINGAVWRHGEALGLRAPVNRFLTKTLESLADGRQSPEAWRGQVDRLLALAEAARAGQQDQDR